MSARSVRVTGMRSQLCAGPVRGSLFIGSVRRLRRGEPRYEPTALAVLVRSSDATDGDTHAWPLGDLTGTDCVVLTGADVATASAAARGTNDGHVWESAGATYTVPFRPLLPDERTCADLSPDR